MKEQIRWGPPALGHLDAARFRGGEEQTRKSEGQGVVAESGERLTVGSRTRARGKT